MKTYPIYKVKSNYNMPLNNGRDRINISAGDVGTFQAISAKLGSDALFPYVIEAKFNGQVLRFQPKSAANGVIDPPESLKGMLLKDGAFTILVNEQKSTASKFSGIDGMQNNDLGDLSNSEKLDDDFGVESYSNIGGSHHGGRHRGGRGRGWGGFGYPYLGYPIYQEPAIVVTQPYRRITITPLGVEFAKRKKGESFVAQKEDAFLFKLKDGKPVLENDLRKQLGYSDFDVIMNWLNSKGFISVI